MSEDIEYEEFFIPQEVLKSDSLVVVDVRTEEEYDFDHIESSVNIPLHELPYNHEYLRQFDNVVVICKSGIRSEQAMLFLKEVGFPRVYNGGGWKYFATVAAFYDKN